MKLLVVFFKQSFEENKHININIKGIFRQNNDKNILQIDLMYPNQAKLTFLEVSALFSV
jgi:hypothetical protein